jgi:serine/threonine protein kinase/tetratricopeptide (TPR) repeat protein
VRAVDHEAAPERILGDRYQLVRELGRGGMGVVYLGRDLRLEMDVAIKFRGLSHADATLWLKREFRAVASLRHPNLVELYELVAHDRSCYFTMEYLPGVDPRRFVLRPTSMPPPPLVDLGSTQTVSPLQHALTELSNRAEAASVGQFAVAQPAPVDHARVRSVLAQLAEGLAFLHARGVIHRDVKPSNAIVVDGTVKLLDFGLALERHRQDDDVAREARVVGTAAYLAPEYLERLLVGPAMDVYALGIVAYELIAGAPPFGGAVGFLSRFKRPALPRVSVVDPAVPHDLDELIARMLAHDPAMRPTALDIAAALSGALTNPRIALRAQEFVGRARELAHIRSRVEASEPRGRLILTTGPSGVGKTALIEEVARTSGVMTWRGKCHERERVAYRAFDSIIDDLATQLANDPTLLHTVEHAGTLARAFPVLAPLIEPVVGAGQPALDLRVERERALYALCQLFRALLPRGPAIILIDDLQWADGDSLELLALLVERVERPLTVLATWMTDEPPRAMRTLLDRLGGLAELLDLPAMPELEVAALIHNLAPELPTARLATAAAAALGNPYLAEMIGRELADSDLSMPPTAQHAESRRIERLDDGERLVAELAALATGATSFQQLRDLAELPSGRLSSVLRGLEEARVLRATPSASGDPVYAFYHQRLRDAAYESMPARVRVDRHARFASWYERATDTNPEQLAFHWQRAGKPGRAQRWAIAAGDAAFAQLAWALAADWYQRALELEPSPATQSDVIAIQPIALDRWPSLLGHTRRPLRGKLAEALLYDGKLAAAAEHFLAVANAEPGDGDPYRVRAAEALLKLGELDRGLALLDEVLARRGEHRSTNRALSITRAIAIGARWLAPLPRRHAAADPVLASAYRAIASYLSTPHPIEALEYVLRGVALAERTGDLAAYSQGLAMLAGYLAAGTLGRFGDRALARAEQHASASNALYPRMVIHGARGILYTLRGDWTGMRDAHAAGERVCRELGLERSWEASFLRSYWALGEIYAGSPARALELLDASQTGADDLFARALIGSHRGRALILTGDLRLARSLSRELDRSPHTGVGVAAIYRGVFAAELALADHDWAHASRITSELSQLARSQWLSTMPAITTLIEVPSAIADLGLARTGQPAAASRALATAKRIYGRSKHSFYAATALRLQAQAQLLLGDAGWQRTLDRASMQRGGEIDRIAIAALQHPSRDLGPLAAAVRWNSGGAVG